MTLLLLYRRAPLLISLRHKSIDFTVLGFVLTVYRSRYGDRVMVRTFASEAGGSGSNPGCIIPKTLKMVPVAILLGAQHLKKITSMMGTPCNTLFIRCLEYLADSDQFYVKSW